MPTLFQWIHLGAAVVGVGGIGFLLMVLIPSGAILEPRHRDQLFRAVTGRFRWISWSIIVLLTASGLYNVRQYYWEAPWGRAWKLLAAKVALALVVFSISLSLTLPLKPFNWFRARRKFWLTAAFTLAMIVILISAYLRRA
jgi:uncharacterized membrane protein